MAQVLKLSPSWVSSNFFPYRREKQSYAALYEYTLSLNVELRRLFTGKERIGDNSMSKEKYLAVFKLSTCKIHKVDISHSH